MAQAEGKCTVRLHSVFLESYSPENAKQIVANLYVDAMAVGKGLKATVFHRGRYVFNPETADVWETTFDRRSVRTTKLCLKISKKGLRSKLIGEAVFSIPDGVSFAARIIPQLKDKHDKVVGEADVQISLAMKGGNLMILKPNASARQELLGRQGTASSGASELAPLTPTRRNGTPLSPGSEASTGTAGSAGSGAIMCGQVPLRLSHYSTQRPARDRDDVSVQSMPNPRVRPLRRPSPGPQSDNFPLSPTSQPPRYARTKPSLEERLSRLTAQQSCPPNPETFNVVESSTS